jgi:putative ATP-dependent endonuclease of the OLD family
LGITLARIRLIEISHFRGIKSLRWSPTPGINCLIGPGDSSKSTILDAIDFCVGARRSIQFTDADFYKLDVDTPVSITVSIGDLEDALKSIDTYGLYLRSFDQATGVLDDEPSSGGETVLSLNLTLASDLEPVWTLISDRAAAQGQTRNLAWGDRTRLAPTRIGVVADYNLGWRRGSVLNNLSEERADTSAALVKSAREARAAFGGQADAQLGKALEIVTTVAKELGIQAVGNAKAMLDTHAVSFNGGAISLHSEDGIPLRGLGVGSARLLIAGLQRRAAAQASIILIDELEHGLEPHRICRLLSSIGGKENAPLQAFVTTHSPIALRELTGNQLAVVRNRGELHGVMSVGIDDGIQSTIRLFPDAFLAKRTVVCEGASEVGFLRGLDQFYVQSGYLSIQAAGTALVDAGGGNNIYKRVTALASLGYRVAVFRDDDAKPNEEDETAFLAGGGTLTVWRSGRTLEDELFLSLSDDGVIKLLTRAIELHGEETVEQHIRSASGGALGLADCPLQITPEIRKLLGKASRTRKAGWFKSVTWMEDATRDIYAPDKRNADPNFNAIVDALRVCPERSCGIA